MADPKKPPADDPKKDPDPKKGDDPKGTDEPRPPATTPPATTTPATTPPVAGDLIAGCDIDLPLNDVVEAIEFERFFVLNIHFQDFQRPATLISAWASMAKKLDLSDEQAQAASYALDRGAPLSTKRADWEPRVLKQVNAVPKAARGRSAKAQGMETGFGAANAVNAANAINIADFRLAFYLPYRQEWQLHGYSRGRMIDSLTLGPQEEQTIEIFKWDRISSTFDSTTSFESEQTNESSGTRRDTTDISKDISRQAGFELTSDAKVGFKVEVVNVDISAGMNAKTALNEADKDSRNTITEATSRAATHVRSSRTLKVTETHEYGQETRITRKLRNYNTCHTLTTAFFEILANYTVSTFLKTASIRLVVLLKSSELSRITGFDRRTIRSHERTLTLALLDSTLIPGFAAARYLDARDRACAVLCDGCECALHGGEVGRDKEWDDLAAALTALGTVVAGLRSYMVFFPASVALAVVEAVTGPGPGIKDIRRHMFMKALQIHAPRLLQDLAGLGFGSVTPALADSAMTVINGIPADALAGLAADKGVSDGEGALIYTAIFFTIPADPISAAIIAGIQTGAFLGAIGGLGTFDDGGLLTAMADVKTKYAAWQAYLAAKREDDAKHKELERIASEERALRLLDAFPLRETADAQERLEALLDHLNDERNIDHYRFAVWNERAGSTDPQLLALALSGFTDGAPVGVVGDDLAVPVKIPAGSTLESFFKGSIVDLLAMSPRDDDDHILPTAAIYAEAIPGDCNACEPNAVRNEELDLARKELENSLRQAELDRLTARLGAKMYDGPASPPAIQVELTTAPAAAGATTPTP